MGTQALGHKASGCLPSVPIYHHPQNRESQPTGPVVTLKTGSRQQNDWHGCRQLCLMDEYGFPRPKPKQKKFQHGFRTGDMVRAVVPAHLKHPGMHVGRISAKATGAFTIATRSGKATDIGKKYWRRLQRADGYGYLQTGETAFPPSP